MNTPYHDNRSFLFPGFISVLLVVSLAFSSFSASPPKQKKYLVLKNRIPVGQVDQEILRTISKITLAEFEELQHSHQLEFLSDLFSIKSIKEVEVSRLDPIRISHDSYQHLYRYSQVRFQDIGLTIPKDVFTHNRRFDEVVYMPFDSLNIIPLDTPFIYKDVKGPWLTLYCIEYYDPAKVFGPDIVKNFNQLNVLYHELHRKITPEPGDTLEWVRFKSSVLSFLLKYPENPYLPSISYFLSRSGTFLHQDKDRDFYLKMLNHYAGRKELFDEPGLKTIKALLTGFQKKWNISRLEIDGIFAPLLNNPQPEKNLFKQVYLDFVAQLK